MDTPAISQAYNTWATQYDTNQNKTRDLEATSLRNALHNQQFGRGLEIGCGTGKNTLFLASICHQVVAVDFSEAMLAKAREKVEPTFGNVQWVQADITRDWNFASSTFDLITFSLVLEHIEHLEPIFEKASRVAARGCWLYVGELHPFKQYMGSKARFETGQGTQIVTCYTHHLSAFTQAAAKQGFVIHQVQEYFDEGGLNNIPRLLTLVFRNLE
ncbi:MAG TPA: class I SAM-dependent methyltransferase [Phnomibacter sp.]|nr:class I SAM-dependent methyltransferase [Phnomibacter sp.]